MSEYRLHRSGVYVPQGAPLDALEAVAAAVRIIHEHNAAAVQGVQATLVPGTLPMPRTSYWPRLWDWVMRIMPASRDSAREPSSAKLSRELAQSGPPVGVICIWAGVLTSIPTGWAICDGNNGTPNLLGVFLKGIATAATDPGGTGGGGTASHSAHTGTAVSDHTFGLRNTGSSGAAVSITHDVTQPSAHSAHSAASMEPAYYRVAFIMRVGG